MFAAMVTVLAAAAIKTGNLKITIEAMPVFLGALMLGPVDGMVIGGIGTLIGASANVVLSGMSGRYGYPISFMDYTKVGFPLMLVFTAISCAWLLIRFCVF